VRAQRAGDGLVRGEWLSAERADRGVILYLHGGGYVACSPSTHRAITAALVRLAGRRVFALDYRLAPEHRFPAALDDAVAAYRWLLGACRRNHDREKRGTAKPQGPSPSPVSAHGDATRRAEVGQPTRPIIVFGISPTRS
jgi:hypothetical protein